MNAMILLSAAAAFTMIPGCQPSDGGSPRTLAAVSAPAAASPQPLAAFSRFIGGRWKMTTTAGTDTYDTWAWGPGKQSIRSMRIGTLPDGDPWRTMTVYYWHPTLKEIRLHSVGSVWRGVGEGTIRFEGETAETLLTLHQVGGPADRPRGPRSLRERWTFAGPDKYHDDLSEEVRGEYEVLAGWDRARVASVPPAKPVKAALLAPSSTPSDLMHPLAKVLGQAWVSSAARGGEAAQPEGEPRTRTAFEFVPYADAILGRVDVIGADGAPSHAIDIYLYHHTGTGTLRVLATGSGELNDGPVYEGDIVPSADGTSLAITLTEHRSAGPRALEGRVDFEKDGTARVQVWTFNGPERTMVMDRRQSRSQEWVASSTQHERRWCVQPASTDPARDPSSFTFLTMTTKPIFRPPTRSRVQGGRKRP